MNEIVVSRRTLLGSTPLLAAPALLGAGSAAQAQPIDPGQANEMLSDPATRARVRARIIGSCDQAVSMKFYRLNIYGFAGDGNLIPFFTMNHLSVADWKPAADNIYESRTWECGYYCKFDTDEPLEKWENPLTGETLDVFHFLGGPFSVNVGADGIVTRGADLDPITLRMEKVGDQVIVPTIASMALPNMVDPEKYPSSYSGPKIFWESQATFAAHASDAFDEEQHSVPAFCHFQNLASWHPWLRMGDRPGRTYGNAIGAKIKSLDEIAPQIRAGFEKYTPEIFDRDSWQTPRFETLEYLKTQTPKA